jgi:hypothetical protein
VSVVRQVNSLLQTLIGRNEMVIFSFNILGGGGGNGCKVLLLQRKTELFGNLYSFSLADQSCIAQLHKCVTALCTR